MDELELIKKLPKLEKREWSYLEKIGVDKRETVIANILGYYFDPNEKHGLGDTFIKALLRTKPFKLNNKVKTKLPQFDNSPGNYNDAEIIIEKITDENKRLDILILSKDTAIAIEFKINHDLNNPLNNYVDKTLEYKKKNNYFVVLTPYWKDPISLAKKNIGYDNGEFVQITLAGFIKNVEKQVDSVKLAQENTQQFFIYQDFIKTITNRSKRVNMINEYYKIVSKGKLEIKDRNDKILRTEDVEKKDIDNIFKNLAEIKKEFDSRIVILNKKLSKKYQTKILDKKELESVLVLKINNEKSIKYRLSLEGWTIGLYSENSGKSTQIDIDKIKFDKNLTFMEISIESVLATSKKKFEEYFNSL